MKQSYAMRNFFTAFLLLCTTALITACGSDSGFKVEPIPSGFVSVINAIPDSPLISVRSNNINIGSVSYGRTTGTSTLLPQISVPILFQYSDNGTLRTLAEENIFLEVNETRIFILSGTINNPKVLSVSRNPTEFSADSTATQISFANASSLETASIELTNPNGSNQTITVNKDEITNAVTTTGGDKLQAAVKTSAGETLWQSGEFNLSVRQSRLFVLIDYFGPTNQTVSSKVRMFSFAEQTGAGLFANEQLPAAIRFANMVSDTGPVDLLAGTTTLIPDISFPAVSDDIILAAGNTEFSVKLNAGASDEIASLDITLLPGTNYILGASVLDGTGGMSLLTEDRRRVPSRARFNVMNLSATAASVDLFLMDTGVAAGPVGRLASNFSHLLSTSTDIRSRTFDFIVNTTATDTTLVGPITLNIETNKVYTILIRDNAGGGAPIQLVQLDDFTN